MECFAVYVDEIEGRIDPHFYRVEIKKIKNALKNKCGEHLFGEVIKEIYRYPTFYGINYLSSGIKVIKGESITKEGIIEQDIEFDYINKETHKRFIKTHIRKGDLVFTVRGFVGKVGYYNLEDEANINANVIKIRIKENFNPQFFWIFLNSVKGQLLIENLTSGQVQKTITVPDIKNIQVPIPDIKIQNHIVQIMDNAYKIKKQKGTEAKQLLDSIDEFVIQELKINFKKKKRTTFSINLDNIKNRLDPLFYSTDLYYFLNNSEYPNATIESICNNLITGFAAGKNDQNLNKEGIIQIRPTNINQQRQLVFEKCIFIDFKQKGKRNSYLLNNEDILFNNTNSQELVGKSTFFNIEGNYFCSNHITRIRIKKEKINSLYLTHILNLYQRNNFFFRICTNWNNQSGININLLKTIKIPLPTLSIQNKIAEEVKRRMQKAERLQNEAKQLLQEAKAKVEKIILSE